MGLFFEKQRSGRDPMERAIAEALEEDPSKANSKEAAMRAAKAEQEAKNATTNVAKPVPIAFAGLLVIVLVVGSLYFAVIADRQAIAEATKLLEHPDYKSPELMMRTTATWIQTLAAAWSAGVLGLIVGERAATT